MFIAGSLQARPVIYELFTSQGCSSCPSADRLATRFSGMHEELLVLSYHVDYWNKLGWKDPYSSQAATTRQYKYANAFGTTRVYTPQAVIQGEHDLVGSDESGLAKRLKQEKHGEWINPKLSRQGNLVRIDLPAHTGEPLELLMVGFTKRTQNAVPRGENRGRTLSHINSVSEMVSLGMWNGEAKTLQANLQDARSDGVALLIQRKGTGRMLGGAWQ